MKILVIAAHPDDEVLGCGATIAKHTRKGDIVDVLILGDGITARYEENELNKLEVIDQVKEMEKQVFEVGNVLGINKLQLEGFNCGRFDKIPLINFVKIIEKKIEEFKPNRIYTHDLNDVNIDHGIVFKAVQTATRPLDGASVKEIYTMEILSSTEWAFANSFRPNYYVNINEFLQFKIDAMKKYGKELRQFPHPRSEEAIINLAKKRGSEVGLRASESFKVLRIID